MNDTHAKVAAILHIVMALLHLLVLGFIAIVFGGIASVVGHEAVHGAVDQRAAGWVVSFLASALSVLATVIALVELSDLVAAVLYLGGSRGARVWLMITSVLMLPHIPLGTAIGAYSLWALSRPEAIPAPR